jgi:mannose/cellobiose epimerase-like protein (N-acyl-D-glucosamine 2-epimerase family)
MRISRAVIAFFGLLPVCALPELHAQYAVRSPYLQHPEIAIAYVDSCARFWLQAYDSVYGGFYVGIGRTGTVKGTNKNAVIQSRDAYGFTRAFMLTGDETYLKFARRALDFMYSHDWDQASGGWYDSNNRTGNPTGSTVKTAFDQHYALLGPATYYEATRDTLDWRWLMKGYDSNERNVWDARPLSAGYYDNAASNWSGQNAKSFNATVDAITTHVLSLYLLTRDDVYKSRLLSLTANILDYLVPSMEPQQIGFVELYHSDWTWDNSTANNNTRTIMGHVLKTAWCLGRVNMLFPDTSYVAAAEKLAGSVWQKGYDHELGGPYKDYDRLTGQMMMYGQDTAKAWWQMEQAFTAGLMLYEITGKQQYLQMADETVDFFMKYFVDHVYGDVYSDRMRKGGPIPAWGDDKGNEGKGGYHSTEFGYYVYLYGKLFVTHEPVTLHYRFIADTADRIFPMNPLAWDGGKYRIGGVLLNGVPFSDYDPAARTLHLSPGLGGHFTVRYEGVTTGLSVSGRHAPLEFRLEQNYPNPFNPATTISYRIPSGGRVTLAVFDMLGNRVATLVDGAVEPGTYTATWNAAGASSGVYFYRLSASGHTLTKKAILLR